MKLPINIAVKLQAMLNGEEISASSLKQPIILKMVEDGIIQSKFISKTKRSYFIHDKENLKNYLSLDFGINDLSAYIEQINHPNLLRSDAIEIASNSKIKNIRTFKGFLINCYEPIEIKIQQKEITLQPNAGIFHFIYDYESLEIPTNITIVGIENAENFRHIHQQKYLFNHITPVFISRYPQNNDAIKWLKSIPNNYLHFGDFDFEGINIFLHEYKNQLGKKAHFFIPDNIEQLIKTYGNAAIYNKQINKQPDILKIDNKKMIELINLIHKYKKGLEQEIFINLK